MIIKQPERNDTQMLLKVPKSVKDKLQYMTTVNNGISLNKLVNHILKQWLYKHSKELKEYAVHQA